MTFVFLILLLCCLCKRLKLSKVNCIHGCHTCEPLITTTKNTVIQVGTGKQQKHDWITCFYDIMVFLQAFLSPIVTMYFPLSCVKQICCINNAPRVSVSCLSRNLFLSQAFTKEYSHVHFLLRNLKKPIVRRRIGERSSN